MHETDPPPVAERHADELLPPVEPPAATFIMQLFFIPLIIVSVIVGIWMLFSWISNLGTQPTELVNDIEHLNHASWQKALTLANTLRDPRHEHLREDPALAGRISTLLDQKIQSEQYDRDNLWLQIYLCRVLGEFNIDTGLPSLINATPARPTTGSSRSTAQCTTGYRPARRSDWNRASDGQSWPHPRSD